MPRLYPRVRLAAFLSMSLLPLASRPASAQSEAADAPTPAIAWPWDASGAANPILPGYYADPSVVAHDGHYYLYATLDPWGGETLGCWESTDFKNWTYRVLNWPTKAACTSPTSKGAMVWAPSVVRGGDGKFHMFVSVGSEVWVGIADHPLGPWRNALGDRPLIPATWNETYHMIDGEAFIDDDGTPYLYWGSGWNWTNGHCFVVKLNATLTGFDGEPRDVTPSNYFEGPLMVKHAGRYYLTYSQGRTTNDTYQVHYAIGDSPLGPFKEAPNSPILVSNADRRVLGPGHHTVMRHDGRSYILYHRHSIPFVPGQVHRQMCIDELNFTADGLIAPVVPTHRGPDFVQGRATFPAGWIPGMSISAPAPVDPAHLPSHAIDDNYATLWRPAAEASGSWLELDFGQMRTLRGSELRFEFAWKPYRFALEYSTDGKTWKTAADFRAAPGATGSPVTVEHAIEARYLRLVFPADVKGADMGLFEWRPW